MKAPGDDLELQQRLRALPDPVRYDVSRGLQRHRALVAAQAPLPAWAEAPKPRWSWLRRGLWTSATLGVLATLWLWRGDARHATSAAPARVPRGTATAAQAAPTRAAPTAPPLAAPAEQAEPAQLALPAAPEGAPMEPTSRAQPHTAQATGTLAPALARSGRRRASGSTAVPATTSRAVRTAELTTPRDLEEMRLLSEAERSLARDPQRALELARQGERAYPRGYFTQERRYVEVRALFSLGWLGEAHARAEAFLRDYPDGPYTQKVRRERLRKPEP